ncbi:sugar phosphate isomerase/epimerase family protein [Mucisphaera calidilacus]|uniref:Inosose dehydratase n=1 Tax=Mucisphaera calidilacus TaxID=2527982 RepID=A0A518BYH1_9BACT|nr:sugar phosphate isomerase/epimerase [Mucisphaera calidilacus]QDU72020.1 Inosose dehydratase [Mucisphaera calidilacus]
MKIDQVALQCYTIRDHCKTEADFAEAMKKTAAIGYKAVQISAIGPIAPDDVRKICDDNGLVICATHEDSKTILSDPASLFDKLKTFGCIDTAYPFPSIEHTEAGYRELAAKLAVSADAFKEAGLRLSYHNHALEFVNYGGVNAMELLFDANPDLGFELDTYWVQFGGGSPAGWCGKCKGRLPVIHLKDYTVLDNNTVKMASVGDGNIDFAEVIRVAEASGCEWFVVEQDRDWADDDPFVAAKRSFDYIKANLVA